MKYKEIELKYSAEDISLADFTKFCKERKPETFIQGSGYDHFYSNPKDPDAFCRHRVGEDTNQLTFKRKISDLNNFIRTEHNIDLKPNTSVDQIKAFSSEFGYIYNTSLFKTFFVYKYEWYILVYYICYNLEMKETGRFIEIEAEEDHAWENEQEAWDSIKVVERFAKPLGLSPQHRMKRSLWELFKKDPP